MITPLTMLTVKQSIASATDKNNISRIFIIVLPLIETGDKITKK